MHAVHFGPGNIGRALIGLFLRESGYRLTFICRDAKKAQLINDTRAYPVYLVHGNDKEERWVRDIQAICLDDRAAVTKAISLADIVTTSIGKPALRYVAPVIAEGILRRSPKDPRIIVMACENVPGNTKCLEWRIRNAAGCCEFFLDSRAVFPNCMVDRIIPYDTRGGHPLAVTAERYAQWVIDSTRLDAIPPIISARFHVGLDRLFAQKLFTLNMAQAVLGYCGYERGYQFVHEALEDSVIRALLDGALFESAAALYQRHGIDSGHQSDYAAQVVERLHNSVLVDETCRLSRQPLRKLRANDRLLGPTLAAFEFGMEVRHLPKVVGSALRYRNRADSESMALQELIQKHDVPAVLAHVAGMPRKHPLITLICNRL